ncbi:M61 family metallopeptidase [Sphingomonas sp. M1-B02]|uniref:M61 family metallopeptidase n=1 Tax=Sphingomonas sp. M1-B02 TaxID=3114300 RepID=UPI00223E8F11|nr:peptidase M61 [Sphingomonas sp. S6-11]UZK66664.1 peptidase M61 [Sphingomonas sp. S6-11]
MQKSEEFIGALARPSNGAAPPCADAQSPPIPKPRDVPYPGQLALNIDATDTDRGILHGHLTLPVAGPGPMVLLYPKWMPGYHSPQNPLELFAGLQIMAGEVLLDWRRDPVEVYAFHIDVPGGVAALEVDFQFLSPSTSNQGDVVVTSDLSNLQWGRMLLYPAGYYSRGIQIRATLVLPEGWMFSTVLDARTEDGPTVEFEPVPLDVLVDSPVMAGRFAQEIPLDGEGTVRLSLYGHDGADLQASSGQLALKTALVDQATQLFASRHYDRYRFLVALSEELGGGGVEHHRSAEIVVPPDYFREWDANLPKRDVFAHEFIHSWNGKFRRAADSWAPSFEEPIRNDLMWVYEGQTQYWGHVLTARAGLWSTDMALQALAKVAATYDVRPGGLWRTMADTTRDPVIASRAPLPWPSWQRSEDYYSEGQLLWLAVDTLIRERSGDTRSLDDFAAAFFGVDDGSMVTRTYDFGDVVRTLGGIVDHDWASLLTHELRSRKPGAPLEGLERGGYRLVYRRYRNDFCKRYDALAQQLDMRFSIGLNIGADGTIQEVMWGSAAFHAGLTSGARIERVQGDEYDARRIGKAIDAACDGAPLHLRVRARPQARPRDIAILYHSGHRFPHLEPVAGARARLDEIFAPR